MVTAFVICRLPVFFPPAGENPFSNFLKSINMKCLLVFLAGYTLLGQPAHAIAQGAGATRDQPAIARTQPGVNAAQGTGDANDKANDRGAAKSREQVAADRSQLRACCQKIARDVQRIYYLNNRNGKMRLVVRGIYTRGKSLFFSLKLINRSALDYDVDSIRFFVAEKHPGGLIRVKELAPMYVFDSAAQVRGFSRAATVYVLPRLTLARHCRLQVEVLEKNGGRHLQVQASNFTLETAKLI
jgi:hypothetical protein